MGSEVVGQLIRDLPLPTIGAIGFYLSLLLMVIRPWREFVASRFRPRTPATQSVIAPLDGLRGLAALWVACFHCWEWMRPYYDPVGEAVPFLMRGQKAVPTFIIISGFLVYRSIRKYTTIEHLRSYFRRRFFRIYPVYFIVLVTWFAFGPMKAPETLQNFLAQILMLKVFFYFQNLYPPFWSLYAEELFYLSLPVWVAMTRARPFVYAVLAFALTALPSAVGPNETALLPFFFIGMILCEIVESPKWSEWGRRLSWLLFAAGVGLIYADIVIGDVVGYVVSRFFQMLGFLVYQNRDYTLSLCLGAGLLFLGIIFNRHLYKAMSIPPLRFLGTISYSSYVWHPILIVTGTNLVLDNRLNNVVWLDMPALGPGVVAPLWVFPLVYMTGLTFWSALSYAVIEKPFLDYSHRSM